MISGLAGPSVAKQGFLNDFDPEKMAKEVEFLRADLGEILSDCATGIIVSRKIIL